jgi:hypothetical protein
VVGGALVEDPCHTIALVDGDRGARDVEAPRDADILSMSRRRKDDEHKAEEHGCKV